MAVIISASPGSGLPTISELTTPDPTIKAVEQQLAMDFDVYRALIKDEIRKSNPAHSEQVKDVLKDIHSNVEVLWEDIFNPAIRSGFLISGHGIPDEVTQAAVGRYSGVLAEQVNAVSDQAFLEGYNAALAKGWDRAVAWDRIARAYGIDPLQMRGWVSAYPLEGYHPHDLPAKSQQQLEKMLDVRSKRIGKSEALTLRNLGKQAMWENQLRRDQISGNAKKVWRTAKDELVCPVCAPMDSIAIPVGKKFKTANGKFYVPPVHINCRCDVYILNNENDVIKSMGKDKYNRDSHGRFSRTEGRTRNVGNRSSGKRSFKAMAQPKEKVNAFGVRHEKKKTAEELEQERIDALPEKMPDLDERMPAWGQNVTQTESAAADEAEKDREREKDPERVKESEGEKIRIALNIPPNANVWGWTVAELVNTYGNLQDHHSAESVESTLDTLSQFNKTHAFNHMGDIGDRPMWMEINGDNIKYDEEKDEYQYFDPNPSDPQVAWATQATIDNRVMERNRDRDAFSPEEGRDVWKILEIKYAPATDVYDDPDLGDGELRKLKPVQALGYSGTVQIPEMNMAGIGQLKSRNGQ